MPFIETETEIQIETETEIRIETERFRTHTLTHMCTYMHIYTHTRVCACEVQKASQLHRMVPAGSKLGALIMLCM